MDHKIPGNYYLVEVSGWNEAGFAVARYEYDEHKGPMWVDVSGGSYCTDHVRSYKDLEKVGKMRPFAVLYFKKLS